MDIVTHGTDENVLPAPVTGVTPLEPHWRVELLQHGPTSERLVRTVEATGEQGLGDLCAAWLALPEEDHYYLRSTRLDKPLPMIVEERGEPEPGTPLPEGIGGYSLGRRGLVIR